MRPRHVVVVGGSIAGLGTALALAGRGHRVTVLEADSAPLPATAEEAFLRWRRQGSPQARHSHALLARLRNLIRDHEPRLLEELKAHGAGEMRFVDRARQLFGELVVEEGDEDIVSLACRRITFEWVLRRYVAATGRVEFLDGRRVTRLAAEDGGRPAPPRITGVWLGEAGGERRIDADLVVDASGRRSRLRHLLPAIGTPPIREESSPCGIFYTSRFYRLHDGALAPEIDGGLVGADLGYLKVGVFAGDSRVFSITLAASPSDDPMRRILHQAPFEAAVAAIPISAEWTSAEMASPVSDVHGMADLRNTRRWLVEDDRPLALGVVAVGDSLIHTNPIVGRGCSLAWTAAYGLADCLDEHDDPLDLALAYDALVERELVPWYRMQLAQDRDGIEVAEAQQRGEDPFLTTNPDGTTNPKGFLRSLLRDGLGPGLREDVGLLRRLMRSVNLLEAPGDLMKDPAVMQSVLAAYARREQRERVQEGPTRSEMIERLEAAEAGAASASG